MQLVSCIGLTGHLSQIYTSAFFPGMATWISPVCCVFNVPVYNSMRIWAWLAARKSGLVHRSEWLPHEPTTVAFCAESLPLSFAQS